MGGRRRGVGERREEGGKRERRRGKGEEELRWRKGRGRGGAVVAPAAQGRFS